MLFFAGAKVKVNTKSFEFFYAFILVSYQKEQLNKQIHIDFGKTTNLLFLSAL